MPIRWDSLLVRHLARELDQTLSGTRLRALRFDARTRDVALFFRDRTLLWRLHPERSAVLEREVVEPADGDLKLKARVRSVDAPADDRIVRFELTGERAGQGPWELIVELMGNQMNAVVTEGVARTVRHALRTREGRRPTRVGHPYIQPSASSRLGSTRPLTEAEWLAATAAVPPPELERELCRRIAWISPLNVAAFLPASPGESGLVEAWRRWVVAADPEAATEPVTLGEEGHGQPYPFPVPGIPARPCASLVAAFAESGSAAGGAEEDAVLRIGPELIERLSDAITHADRRVLSLQAALDGRDDPAAVRAVGDLILARYGEIPTGAETVTLADFNGSPTEIELDPALAPHENADRYYDRAARSERAAERLPPLINKARSERDRFVELRRRAEAGSADADTIRAALPAVPARQRRGNQEAAAPFRTYHSSGGLEIRVGRGARHNDDLTFRHSAPNDIWLHARHSAGAHVILRWHGEGAPPARDLEEAAVLAALNSRSRTSSSVPVDWTRRKHVRKPRGSAPGAVVPDRVKTVFVAPDERVAERLASDD